MRNAAVEKLFELAVQDRRLLFAASDISEGVVSVFREKLPGQFFMEGIAEAHMIGMAAGLAKEGNTVFVNTIASFLTRRCLEQIMVNVCLENADVKLLAQGGGLVYARHGPTHHANEDIALMRALPRMKVILPCDLGQTRQAVEWAAKNNGPVYIRLSKGNVAQVSDGFAMQEGQVHVYRQPENILFIASGVMTQTALEVSAALPGSGVIGIPFLKPFPDEALSPWLAKAGRVVVIEEHSSIGGLYSCVCESAVKKGGPVPAVLGINLGDQFIYRYGRQEELWQEHGLDPGSILRKVRDWLGRT